MLLTEVTWMEVEEYLRKDDRLILPVGSCEQHGRHLTFATDTEIPWALAQRLATRTGVMAAPPLAFGMSLHHMRFPGTLSFKPSTFVAAMTDLVESAHQHGFRRVLVLNGHGGNIAPLQGLGSDVCNRLEGLRLKIGNWWETPGVAPIEMARFGGREFHASGVETSVVLALRPGVVRQARAEFSPPAQTALFPDAGEFRKRYPHGAAGVDPRKATAAIGEEVLAAAEEGFLAELESGW